MTETRIKFSNIVKNQLPAYVREEFPLISEFLSQYYVSQEFQGAPTDLIQNIDQYIKIDNQSNLTNSAILLTDISFFDDVIEVNPDLSPGGTFGFPDSYGLIQIGDEIITYTGKTQYSFTGCIRGFSGITSLETKNKPDQLTFSTSNSAEHVSGSTITNLSNLFLSEFFKKIKYQFVPGFEDRSFDSKINQSLFIKQSKDFYTSKGTEESFSILFKALYGELVKVIKPKEQIISPSNAQYSITNDFVVEEFEGDPLLLTNQTLYQDSYGEISGGYAPITKVEKIVSGLGQTYYKLSIDAGYNKDLRVSGSTYGNFSIHPKTKLIGQVSAGATILDVDSTVGFPNQGELSVTYNDGSIGVVSYRSKSLTQFFDCTNVTGLILDTTNVGINTYAYADVKVGDAIETVKVNINSVLSDVDILDSTYYTYKNDPILIKTLGVNPEDFTSNNWVFNLATSYDVESISIENNLSNTYRVNLKKNHIFRKGDSIKIINSSSVEKESKIVNVYSKTSFSISGQGNLSLTDTYKIKRNLLKGNSTTYPQISNLNTNVQNVYKIDNKTLVASPSIPSYTEQSLDFYNDTVIFSGTFPSASTNIFKITTNTDHGFYTGDVVYYTPADSLSSLFSEGIYYIKRVDSNNVQFAKSDSDIQNQLFVSITDPVSVSNDKIELYKFKSKELKSQKLLREISDPVNDGGEYPTPIGQTGILVNGVEVLNYKSYDSVYYGEIESVEVTSTGYDYDIINPPVLNISDSTGSGAEAFCAVKGSLQEIKIIDSGFDYTEVPSVKITGGNGVNAKASANMKLVTHEVAFNSESNYFVGIGSNISTIGFSTYHKFRNAERVIYSTNSQQGIGGLTTSSSYYVSVQDFYTIKLHNSQNDAISGINTITLSSYGKGIHSIKSYNQKSVVNSISIENPGIGYENKKKTTVSGISTSLDTINITNHEFASGEIVTYTTNGVVIGGLIAGNNYYVTKVDEDNFRLSEIGNPVSDFYYKTNQYINFTSKGTGTHTFNYPNIQVEIVGNVGISSIGSQDFKAKVQPIFRGQITSVHLSNGGAKYGSADILNYNKQPLITLNSGSGAQLTPIISNGKVVEVLVNQTGNGYNSPPKLVINGTGYGADLTPILNNGQIQSVKVVNGGTGYSADSTSIIVTSAGTSAKFEVRIKKWTVNLFEKYFNNITNDDGIIFEGINKNYQLQYNHLYAPRKLRDILYPNDQNANTVYSQTDLQNDNDGVTLYHSPIIGWAYDGNPIYGPYGYLKKNGGIVTQLKSGYSLNQNLDRPNFPLGFFVEDYTYVKSSDESVLDEHNGRFCVTPEYPNGTYAYFATLESIPSLSGVFNGYKKPSFPYLIGNTYKSKKNEFNFIASSNQDDIDLNQTGWARNTYPYNLIDNNSSYSYITIPNSLNQTATVGFSSAGSVERIGIQTGGFDYQVGDQIQFDTSDTSGYGLSAEVSLVKGKQVSNISVASSTSYNVEFYPGNSSTDVLAISPNPHGFQNQDIVSVSGLNTTSSNLQRFYNIGVSANTLSIASSISNTSATGIVTYFNVAGNLDASKIRENDILLVGIEQVKVLKVDLPSSRIRVLRQVNGSVGSSHSVTEVLYEIPRKLTLLNSKLNTDKSYKNNREFYFDPKDSVGLGTVGIGSTIVFSNPGVGATQVFVPLRSIYLPNHGLETGDRLVYSTNGGSPLQVSDTGIGSTFLYDQTSVYVAKISNDLIGISTVAIGLGSTGSFVGIASTQRNVSILYFTGIGTGVYHSFKTTYDAIKGNVSRNLVTVSTAQTHGLRNGDTVFVNVSPSISTSVTIKYNDYNRKLLVNSRDFVSSGINTSNYTINIQNHGFVNGQKLVHTSSSPAVGLQNNQIYYAVVVDSNNIKLSDSYYSATSVNPNIIGITSSSNGTLSPVNPPIKVYRNSTVIFDVSDSSLSYTNQSVRYPAFSFDFYIDENFTKPFDSTSQSKVFEVAKTGTIGISTNAAVILTVNQNLPEKLYYKLSPINVDIPQEKSEINVDSLVDSNNQIQIKNSEYNGQFNISVASTNSFTYSLFNLPESSSYISSTSSINYETNSPTAYGAISKVDITNKGKNFYSLPGIGTVISSSGYGAILDSNSQSIGKVSKTKINDIGFDFPSDFTLRPSASLPQSLKIEPLSSFESIGITSFGRGYSSTPKLIVIDGKTNQVDNEVDIRYNPGDTQVTIYKNTYGLNNVTPIILPTQNSNGVGISSIRYNSTTKDVTVTLSSQFSTLSSFPFSVGDKILVENTNVGIITTNSDNQVQIVSDGRGYNSSAYNYNLFTVTSILPNIGGANPTITYNLNGIIGNDEYPGTFDPNNSSGRVIPQKYFPIFSIKLKKNNFLIGEKVTSNSLEGYVSNWNYKTNYLNISSKNNFYPGFIIQGEVSKTRGNIVSVDSFDSFFNLSPYSKVENGWNAETGFLSNNLQRIQDSDYYQTFSYSLKSRVSYDTWNDAVSTLNHTAGFKKFADYQLETSLYYNEGIVDGEKNSDKNSLIVGISTELSYTEVVNDIIEVVDLNCVYDFDLVSENSLQIGSSTISDEVTFSSRILTDYLESVGNRVLLIDDISPQFNSFPRSTNYSEVYRFNLSSARAQKYLLFARDKRYTSQRQLLIATLLQNDSTGFMNQYGRVETVYDLGSFDFGVDGADGVIYFYPTNYTVNDYDVTVVNYNISDNVSGVGTTTIGGIVDLATSYTSIPVGSTSTIVGVSSSVTSLKILVEVSIDSSKYEFDELSLIHDGTNIQILEYGQLTTHSRDQYSSSGLGTYSAYYSGSQLKLDYTPNTGIGTTAFVNTVQVAIANSSVTGIGTIDIKYLLMEAKDVSIASSISPVETVISTYDDNYQSSYYILQVSDVTNNRHQISEVVLVDDDVEVYSSEFGYLDTDDSTSFNGIGTIGATRVGTVTQLTFTPNPNIDVRIKYYMNAIRYQDDFRNVVNFDNTTINTGFGQYYGTERSIKRSFDLTYKTSPIFQKTFDGSDSTVINTSSNTILIPNHFFVTGENVIYTNPGIGNSMSIGIATTSIAGIGVTNKLPSNLYAVKVNDNLIGLSTSASDALASNPKVLDIISVGIGTIHTLTSTNQNAKVVIAIDNIIQSPIVSTAITTTLATNVFTTDNIIYFSGITSFFGGDLIKIGSEIMKIEGVGIGSTNAIRVIRPWLGTVLAGYSTGDTVTKVNGNYNIVNNTLNFIEAPYGNVPQTTSLPNETDWLGISTSSSFQGRVFLRSGILNSSNETYSKNYIFDDISDQFNAVENSFTLKSNQSNISNFYSDNAIVLINDIFQGSGSNKDYTLSEDLGATSITFTGSPRTITNDVGITSFPKGGIIVSVGSTNGFGYQPLVAAGGTAIVSGLGTISAISIGNSGSGYRSGIQNVRVGVATTTVGIANIQFIGTATVNNGSIVSVAITNPGSGYTSTNPPYVIFDSPLSYSNIPLIYSSTSSGFGTSATIDIVVGQGSSVIDFEIKNLGYGYGQGETLTVSIGGTVGIPTVSGSSFSEFQVFVDKTISDKFTGWTVGQLQVLDDISNLFDGQKVVFPISIDGNLTSIQASKGSKVNIQDTLLVFVNDVLQVPGRGYYFLGGSNIIFSEPPKIGDRAKLVFYKGTGSVDVVPRNILETVKVGDELTIQNGNLPIAYLEDSRTVTEINSTNLVTTNPYFGPGNVSDPNLLRPVVWCRQTEDKIIDENEIGKDRMLYEASINPSAYLIQSVGIGSTIIWVDNIRPFFNPINESADTTFQKNVLIISQEEISGAIATAVVSAAGTISSIQISNGGYGYTSNPTVKIQNPVGLGTTATALSSTTSGIVTAITLSNPGYGYTSTNPPVVLIESPKSINENGQVYSYEGDSGLIVGISTISVGIASTGVVFDLYIPQNSYLRNGSITGVTTISGISTGYYFRVYNSNVGNGVTSLNLSGSGIGIGTSFLDNVYQVASVSIAQTSVIGVGITYVARVTTNVSGYNGLSGIGISNFFGEYSWGKITLSGRQKSNTYNAYPVGITTSSLVGRSVPLKRSNYI